MVVDTSLYADRRSSVALHPSIPSATRDAKLYGNSVLSHKQSPILSLQELIRLKGVARVDVDPAEPTAWLVFVATKTLVLTH